MSHDNADSPRDFAKNVWTIVVAGGSGLRFGSRKQFADLAGRSVVQRSVDTAASVSAGVVVVLPADSVESTVVESTSELLLVPGGNTRAESVRLGLNALPDNAELVLVHDAARPLASRELFTRVIDAVSSGARGVVPAVPVADTIRKASGGVVDRSQLLAVQTPQGFDLATLRTAHASNNDATDDATLVEALGHDIVIIEGEAQNNKLTEPSDLLAAASIIEDGNREHDNEAAVTESSNHQQPTIRVGQGFDVHPFSTDPERPMILGGVIFADEKPGLAGHSDADVIAHAITDALLGAAGLGDIGSHFPDTDPSLAGADSIELLSSAAASVREAGWTPQNADCSVVLDAPKLAPHREEMQKRLSDALGAPVTVKGKRPEGIGALGRHEGIACWATALIVSSGGFDGPG